MSYSHRLKLAMRLAAQRHVLDRPTDVKAWHGNRLYTHHLQEVQNRVHHFAFFAKLAVDVEEDLVIAAWCHDLLEDTGTKAKELEELFGQRVAALVVAVTNEPGPNRKTRHLLTYPKIREAGMLAVLLKLADRVANIEAGGSLVQMYRKEQADFRHALYTPGQLEDAWAYLDEALARAQAKERGEVVTT